VQVTAIESQTVQYSTPISLSSQFYFCGLPLRLDTYRGCGFQCCYCFARHRGGNLPGDNIVPADPNVIAGAFDRAATSEPGRLGVIGQFIRQRVPIHFGGMSDPFQPAELRYQVSAAALAVLIKHQYPTVISTRGVLVADQFYVGLLKELSAVLVQFSFCSSRDQLSRLVEPHSTPPSALLRCMETLSHHGVPVSCRWQPFIPGISEEPSEFVRRIASTGCKHIGFEHLKVPLERRKDLWEQMTSAAGEDYYKTYKTLDAYRDGRELLLPPEQKLRTITEVAVEAHRSDLSFGAADNEFQYLSDTSCCCSGADRFPGFENYFKHQIAYAVRSCRGKDITYSTIENEWTPSGSVDRYLNSRSRIGARNNGSSSIRSHILARWNQVKAPGSPGAFFGIVPTRRTVDGAVVYKWEPKALNSGRTWDQEWDSGNKSSDPMN
jgi:DNA repair photolyase